MRKLLGALLAVTLIVGLFGLSPSVATSTSAEPQPVTVKANAYKDGRLTVVDISITNNTTAAISGFEIDAQIPANANLVSAYPGSFKLQGALIKWVNTSGIAPGKTFVGYQYKTVGSSASFSVNVKYWGGTTGLATTGPISVLTKISAPEQAPGTVSKPGEYSGYSNPIPGVNGWVRNSYYVPVSTYADSPTGVPLRNPTKLAVDIYRPAVDGVAVDGRFPVILNFTPYRRAYYSSDGTLVLGGKSYADGLTKYGYVIAVADTRGMGASFGYRRAANDRIEAQDAYDLIEWLAVQPWCDGNVGMTGLSYHGQTILEAISKKPPHLKAAFIGQTDFNKFDGWARGAITRGSAAAVAPWEADLVTAPVDGDSDGPDADSHPDLLYEAAREHQYNGPFTQMLLAIPYRDSWSDYSRSQYWQEVSASTYLAEIDASDVAVYLYGGWYDFLRRDSILTYHNWPNPRKMIVGPWRHGESTGIDLIVEQHRFFDYWLKGIDNGVMEEPPIYYVTMDAPIDGKPQAREWNFASQWPPQAVDHLKLYLADGKSGTAPSRNDGLLSPAAPTQEALRDDFEVDFTVTTNVEPLSSALVPHGVNGTEFDRKGLTYTTNVLASDLKIEGHPLANIWISSDSRDADIVVLLEDVDPSGLSTYVTDGRLRASMRSTATPPYNFIGLPWHRAYQADEQKLVPGEPVELVIDLMPTTYVFKKGHRVRLAVTGSLGNLFSLRPDNPDAPKHLQIYRNRNQASYVTLPTTGKAE